MKGFQRNSFDAEDGFLRRHPVFANIIVIFLVAFLGLWIVYLALKLFTKHDSAEVVPSVENVSYTQAIGILHGEGFRVDIRDSVYNDDFNPGYVVEQFPKPGAKVKPGRKVFLYINAVHPREAVIDVVNQPSEDALKGFSYRQGMARLEELGYKDVSVRWLPGESDRVFRVTANGRTVKKMEKVPVNAHIVLEVYDGKLLSQADSLQNEEYLHFSEEGGEDAEDWISDDNNDEGEPEFVQ